MNISMYINTEELRASRFKKKYSYEYMSKKLSLKSPTSYYNIEVGNVEPKLTQMILIAETLEEPVEKFFKLNIQHC